MIWLAIAFALIVVYVIVVTVALSLGVAAKRGDRMAAEARHEEQVLQSGGARLARVIPMRPESERLESYGGSE